jgi:hypothetical protein
LEFHDSTLQEFRIQFSSGSVKTCEVHIGYYDWEGNAERRTADPKASWKSKKLFQ